jgi:hypothetical protein
MELKSGPELTRASQPPQLSKLAEQPNSMELVELLVCNSTNGRNEPRCGVLNYIPATAYTNIPFRSVTPLSFSLTAIALHCPMLPWDKSQSRRPPWPNAMLCDRPYGHAYNEPQGSHVTSCVRQCSSAQQAATAASNLPLRLQIISNSSSLVPHPTTMEVAPALAVLFSIFKLGWSVLTRIIMRCYYWSNDV